MHSDNPNVNRILEEATRCWNPSPSNRSVYQDKYVQTMMVQSLNKELRILLANRSEGNILPLYPATTHSPLQMFGPLREFLPFHEAVLITHNKKWMSSHCLEFNYESDKRAPDPAGCRFFKRSFSPVKNVARCVQTFFEKDPYWQLSLKLAEFGDMSEQQAADFLPNSVEMSMKEMQTLFARNLRDEFQNTLPNNETRAGIWEANVAEWLQLWRKCKKGLSPSCTRMRVFDRLMESFRNLDINEWDGLSLKRVRASLRRALLRTITSPEQGRLPKLSESTLKGITDDCFKIPQRHRRLAGSVPQFHLIKEALGCFPLMWDAAEVPGTPKRALWQTDWTPPTKQAFPHSHPLCGRLALAGLSRQFQASTYPKLGPELLKYSSWKDVSDKYCMNPKKAQCQNFKDCWDRTMINHVRRVDRHCIVDLRTLYDLRTKPVKKSWRCCCRKVSVVLNSPIGQFGVRMSDVIDQGITLRAVVLDF